MMRENKINPEIFLTIRPSMDMKNVIEAVNEHTGIKIIEAVNMLVKDLPLEQRNKLLSNIDKIIDKVL